jgi:hypothetical protein
MRLERERVVTCGSRLLLLSKDGTEVNAIPFLPSKSQCYFNELGVFLYRYYIWMANCASCSIGIVVA